MGRRILAIVAVLVGITLSVFYAGPVAATYLMTWRPWYPVHVVVVGTGSDVAAGGPQELQGWPELVETRADGPDDDSTFWIFGRASTLLPWILPIGGGASGP